MIVCVVVARESQTARLKYGDWAGSVVVKPESANQPPSYWALVRPIIAAKSTCLRNVTIWEPVLLTGLMKDVGHSLAALIVLLWRVAVS